MFCLGEETWLLERNWINKSLNSVLTAIHVCLFPPLWSLSPLGSASCLSPDERPENFRYTLTSNKVRELASTLYSRAGLSPAYFKPVAPSWGDCAPTGPLALSGDIAVWYDFGGAALGIQRVEAMKHSTMYNKWSSANYKRAKVEKPCTIPFQIKDRIHKMHSSSFSLCLKISNCKTSGQSEFLNCFLFYCTIITAVFSEIESSLVFQKIYF